MYQGIGHPVCSGVAIGRAYVYCREQGKLSGKCGEITEEQKKFEAARTVAREQLTELYEKNRQELGDEQAMILDVQIMMLDDPDYLNGVQERISEGISAAESVRDTGDAFATSFSVLEDTYMQARAIDIRDMSERIVSILCGGRTELSMTEPGILVAEDLTPSEAVQLPKDKILAFITRQGSSNSHVAILARIMNVPALVQAQITVTQTLEGKLMIVDGFEGSYWIEPDENTLASMLIKRKEDQLYRCQLDAYRNVPTVSASGRRIKLLANIGRPDDVQAALDCGAEGVGLLRSEFIYLGRKNLPTEEELFQNYRQVVKQLAGRPLIIRTLDAGADKKMDYLELEKEDNPALGYRGIRISLTRDDIFRPQMRAIYRASAFGSLSVMFPMITSVEEVRRIKAFCEMVKAELRSEKQHFGEVELGIMIETPAAAIISAELAKEVQFFSVGTNDLTQYTLAIDRQNEKLDQFYDAHHPAILSLLQTIVVNAHAQGIWAGICGELGADLSLTETFLRMGYDELSVSPSLVLKVRKKVCESEV